eukprot:gene28951-30153_t
MAQCAPLPPLECGVSFVKDYYTKFAQSPEDMSTMYSEQSVFCHHVTEEAPSPLVGLNQDSVERKFSLTSLECHPSLYGAVL